MSFALRQVPVTKLFKIPFQVKLWQKTVGQKLKSFCYTHYDPSGTTYVGRYQKPRDIERVQLSVCESVGRISRCPTKKILRVPDVIAEALHIDDEWEEGGGGQAAGRGLRCGPTPLPHFPSCVVVVVAVRLPEAARIRFPLSLNG